MFERVSLFAFLAIITCVIKEDGMSLRFYFSVPITKDRI